MEEQDNNQANQDDHHQQAQPHPQGPHGAHYPDNLIEEQQKEVSEHIAEDEQQHLESQNIPSNGQFTFQESAEKEKMQMKSQKEAIDEFDAIRTAALAKEAMYSRRFTQPNRSKGSLMEREENDQGRKASK